MKFWVGITDKKWFSFLSAISPDEVNFWQPGGGRTFKLEPGAPFLFKLHSPDNFIVGGGFFVRYSAQIPLSLAWETFREKNGAPDFTSLYTSIMGHRDKQSKGESNPAIGCIILTSPFFFPQDRWIHSPEDWKKSIQQGRTYDTDQPIGSGLWNQVETRLQQSKDIPGLNLKGASLAAEEIRRYGSAYVAHARLGQGAFRFVVQETYKRRCAITGERTLPALEAAHIMPYRRSGPHLIENGILMRSDLHKLFDQGYLAITNDLHVEVSRRIKAEYENGREYYKLHGRPLEVIPVNSSQRPSQKFLEWHNENIYLG